MNFSALETFLAVAAARSFSRAAISLHLTHPAVTKRIKTLENTLDTRLFDRVGKQVHLSSGGQLLLPRAENLVAAMHDTQRLLRNLNEQISGSLHLATSHHVGLHRLAPVLKEFSNTFDAVQLDIRFEDSEAAHDLVRKGDSELAVVTLNPEGDRNLDYHALWDDPLCFIVASDHPLASAGAVALPDLPSYPAVLPGLATYTGRIVAGLFSERQIELTSHLSTNYLETISMLAGIGLGWSVLPASMVTGNLVRLNTDAPPLRRTLGCVTNPNRTQSNAAQAFIEVLERFADQPT
ncbi:MAG: LysR family transcriptional regulator [Pseudomonadales bacterium]